MLYFLIQVINIKMEKSQDMWTNKYVKLHQIWCETRAHFVTLVYSGLIVFVSVVADVSDSWMSAFIAGSVLWSV